MVLVRVKKLARIKVRGVVQGVGFRPFVYRLAHQHNLNGWVRNTSANVAIEVEGNEAALKDFIAALETEFPPMARIEGVNATFRAPQGYTGFEIRESRPQKGKYQLVSPDIATCPDCLKELLSPDDRRYGYPFTNCTNCGPRFTIIEDIPYDRPKTTMAGFKMCPECQREYDDPLDRRFHAQPNACPRCGPRLELVSADGRLVEERDVIKAASALLRDGNILAVRGLGGFQLACDATDAAAVATLRQRKRRPAKPLAVMMTILEEVAEHCELSPEEERLLSSPQCPIVLLKWRRDSSHITAGVAPNLKYLGVMLPYTPLHHLLLRETGRPLVMTSGNLSEEPIARDNDEALVRLKGIAGYFLLHNRGISARYDDSVFMVVSEVPRPIRRARGYAPYPIFLPFKARQVLACGAEEKNTFCLTRDAHAFVSQHIGDMENEETLAHFENTIKLYKKLFRIKPEVVAYDMHPEYLATKYARQVASELSLPVVPVQHHHAHIVSCLAEHKARGPVIGVAFDGTGFGSDAAIWGGEFLLADYKGFQRLGHLEYVPLAGGAAAIKRPYRMALSYLYTLLGADFPLEGLPLSGLDPEEIAVVKTQLARGINSPPTSSAGRLFDAVSALTGVRSKIDYEAQAAIELEMQAPDEIDRMEEKTYPFAVTSDQGVRVVRLGELISAVACDARSQVPVPVISFRFHRTVAAIITEVCRGIAQETGINEVALSGGVFQNRLLLRLATSMLEKSGLRVFSHRLVPCNDGGISLGQAVIANFAGRS
ncbi:MAG: carbamoyltransferase HypF [Dehalococcoidales bacterium]|nr:carbamoyltransferase HypF [Dehalococcoidales bacterium]